MDQEDVVKQVWAYVPRFLEAYQKSIDEQDKACYPAIAHKVKSFGRSVLMNNLVNANLSEVFAGDMDVLILPKGHGATVVIRPNGTNSEFDIKCKKLNNKFLTYNSSTQSVMNFVQQLVFEFMSETRDAINLIIGYRIHTTWAKETMDVWITCPNGKKSIAWKYLLSAGTQPQMLESPDTTTPPPATRPTQTVISVPKEKPIKKEANEGINKSQNDPTGERV